MYTQLFKEILLTIEFEDKHIEEFAKHHPGLITLDGTHSNDVKQSVRDYRTKKPIWWYTRGNSLHSMLNDALRIMDGDVLVRMGFFVTDLHRNIEQLHKEQFVNASWSSLVFTVYRGQGLSHTDFAELRNTIDGLMSFNSFFSTSMKRDVSFSYAKSNADNPKLVGILFTIKIDPAQSTTPFALVGNHGRFLQENEVLFSMHTVFRIHHIEVIGTAPPLYEVNISLTLDSDEELRTLTDHIRRESHLDGKGWTRLGQLLIQLGQHKKAEKIYDTLLNQKSHDNDKGLIYHQLGHIRHRQGLFQEAITFYDKSLVLFEKTFPANHPDLATSYNNISSVYVSMGDYRKALDYYEKTLSIQQQSLPANHPDLATSYSNIGSVYVHIGDYRKALEYFEKTLSIQQQSLPANHPDLATSYNNIGLVYNSMGDYPKALEYYEKALLIRQQSLPANHPNIATSYNNIGLVYNSMGDYRKALEYFEKTLSIRKQSLPANHPDLATSYNNIGLVYDSMNDYRKAHFYCERAVQSAKCSRSPNHPHLLRLERNLEYVENKLRHSSFLAIK
ncbi:unnamed protein product [Adineta ricciae]|uniref:Uncharacterized protein n=1 Tax=Adineta ricciae TaxID=249248 RepID=A0A816EPH6_ADIRI|nr:unnamed protein product [Adineta ricciae]